MKRFVEDAWIMRRRRLEREGELRSRGQVRFNWRKCRPRGCPRGRAKCGVCSGSKLGRPQPLPELA